MAKNGNKIFLIIGIIVLILFVNNNQNKSEDVGIKVHYYNNGIEVFPNKLFSIIGGNNYDSISLSISGTNTGNIAENLNIVSASPAAFNNALTKTTQQLSPGQNKVLWTSAQIPTAQFESMSQPVRFFVNVSATNGSAGTVYSSAYVDLTITTSYSGLGSGTSSDPYQITSWAQLNEVRYHSSSSFKLMNNINSGTSGYATYNTGSGWVPIPSFRGNFDGNGKVIRDLRVSDSSSHSIGLFGTLFGNVFDLGIEDCYISPVPGATYTEVGALAGFAMDGSTINNCYSTGIISGDSINWYSDIRGGLIGYLQGGVVTNCYSTVSVSKTGYTGAYKILAGFVGHIERGTITNCYSTGSVSGAAYDKVGGFIGNYYQGTITSSYWDTQTSGLATSAGGIGKTTAQMKTPSTYVGWDTNIWNIAAGSYPTLIYAPAPSNSFCYQESANVATACGGLASGSYSFSNATTRGYIHVNYSKPLSATSGIWNIFYATDSFTLNNINVTIPSSCWNYLPDKLVLRIASDGYYTGPGYNPGGFNYTCYDGSNFINLFGFNFLNGYTAYNVYPTSNYPIDGSIDTWAIWSNNLTSYGWLSLSKPSYSYSDQSIYEEGIYWEIGT